MEDALGTILVLLQVAAGVAEIVEIASKDHPKPQAAQPLGENEQTASWRATPTCRHLELQRPHPITLIQELLPPLMLVTSTVPGDDTARFDVVSNAIIASKVAALTQLVTRTSELPRIEVAAIRRLVQVAQAAIPRLYEHSLTADEARSLLDLAQLTLQELRKS